MKNYIMTTLGDVCQTISATYKDSHDEVVLINTSDVLDGEILNHTKVKNEKLPGQFKKTFQKKDILYSEIRPANKHFAFVDFSDTNQYIASTKLMVIRAKEGRILPEFLYILLTSQKQLIELTFNIVVEAIDHLFVKNDKLKLNADIAFSAINGFCTSFNSLMIPSKTFASKITYDVDSEMYMYLKYKFAK